MASLMKGLHWYLAFSVLILYLRCIRVSILFVGFSANGTPASIANGTQELQHASRRSWQLFQSERFGY